MEELTTPKNKTNKIDYSITPISFYRFVCEDENITSTYVGHTANFTRRKSGHKHDCNTDTSKYYNLKIYQTIRANGGWDNWRMIEIKNQLCESKRHAERIEQELIDQYKAELNTNKAFCVETKEEYNKNYSVKHYLNNKTKKLENQKQYREINKDKVLEYHKQYRQKNKEILAEKRKIFYQNNREKLIEQNKQCRLKKNNKQTYNNSKIEKPSCAEINFCFMN
jgi:hypothetical protein